MEDSLIVFGREPIALLFATVRQILEGCLHSVDDRQRIRRVGKFPVAIDCQRELGIGHCTRGFRLKVDNCSQCDLRGLFDDLS